MPKESLIDLDRRMMKALYRQYPINAYCRRTPKENVVCTGYNIECRDNSRKTGLICGVRLSKKRKRLGKIHGEAT